MTVSEKGRSRRANDYLTHSFFAVKLLFGRIHAILSIMLFGFVTQILWVLNSQKVRRQDLLRR